MKAALLDRNNKVIGEVFDAPKTGNTIEIAGCFTVDRYPVNVRKYKISRSKCALEKAKYEQPVLKMGDVWTFYAIADDQVVY